MVKEEKEEKSSMKEYRLKQTLTYCFVYELWNGIACIRYRLNCHYNGGDVKQFLEDNRDKIVSRLEYFDNMDEAVMKGGTIL